MNYGMHQVFTGIAYLSFTGIKPYQVLLCQCVQILAGFTVQVVSVRLLSNSSAEEGSNVHNKNALMNIGRGHGCNSGELLKIG